MKKLLFCIYILLVQFIAFSQGQNPFELRHAERAVSSAVGQTQQQVSHSVSGSIIDSSGSHFTGASDSLSTFENPFEVRGDRPKSPPVSTPNEENKMDSTEDEVVSPSTFKLRYLIFGIISLLITTLCISSNRYRFNQLVKSTWNSNQLFNLYRETDAWKNGQSFFLYLIFLLNSSLFFFIAQQMKFFGAEISFGWKMSLMVISAVYLTRHLAMMLISWIYPLTPTIGIYNYSIGVNNIVVGVFLLPITLSMVFGPHSLEIFFFYLGLFVLGLIYLIRQLKGFLLAIGMKGFNLIYFFIYLCAIDIAPILLIWRMTSGAS